MPRIPQLGGRVPEYRWTAHRSGLPRGVAADAFHVVAPSIPGFGFSTPVREIGWEMARTARAFAELMDRLGYERYGAQGGDVGAGIVGMLAGLDGEHIAVVHTNSDLLVGDIREFFCGLG
jgi:pimeloyl-ACP methyl ester carboxylesterase